MRYIIYTRVSTNKQTVENQLKECREYVYKLTHKGDEVIEFAEPDSSTKKPMRNRKKLIEMIEKVRPGDKLIVYKVDRLARDPQELINIYCNMVDKGVEVYGLYDPALDRQTICIYAFMAASERNNVQVRTRSALNRKRANGERVGGTWYGYSLDQSKLQTARENAHSYNKPYILVPEEHEQSQVNLMVEMHRQGASYGEIVSELETRGFRNRKGNPVHKSTVWRVLKRLEKQNPAPKELAYA